MYYSRMISKMLSVHLQMVHVSDACLSDYYKDAHGFRPRHYKLWWSYDELDAEIEYLSKVAEENYKAECAREEKALRAFEELIEETINHGAKDVETAIRWLMDGEDVDVEYRLDVEHFFWGHGLSHEKIDEFTNAYYNNNK